MANGRSTGRAKRDNGRDPGAFIALPIAVLDCPAYAALSHTARSLLIEVARQCKGDDNGRLLLSRAYMAGRGWNSAGVIHRAKRELIEGGFIFETVMGHRPNKASWYAVTWRNLDRLEGFDVGAEKAFRRGEYRSDQPLMGVKPPRGYQVLQDVPLAPQGNAGLIPPSGTELPQSGPACGTEGLPCVPAHGAIGSIKRVQPVPAGGHPLEKPSAVRD